MQNKSGRVSRKKFIRALGDYFDKIIWEVVLEAADAFVNIQLLEPIRSDLKNMVITRTIENIEQRHKPGDNLTAYLAIISEHLLKQLGNREMIISFLSKLMGHLLLQLDFFISQNSGTEAVYEMEKAVKESIIINYFEKQTIPLISTLLSKNLNVSIEFLQEFLNKLSDLFKRNLLQTASISDIESYIESALLNRGVNKLTICAVKAVISGYVFQILNHHKEEEFYDQLDAVCQNKIEKCSVDRNLDELINSILINWLNNSIITELAIICPKPELEEFMQEIGDSIIRIAQFRIDGGLNKVGFENALASIKFLLSKVKEIDQSELESFFLNVEIAVEKIAETPKTKNEIDSIAKLLEFKDLGSVSQLEA